MSNIFLSKDMLFVIGNKSVHPAAIVKSLLFLIHQEQSSSHLVENNSLLILQILNFNHIVNSYFIINQVICYILWPR